MVSPLFEYVVPLSTVIVRVQPSAVFSEMLEPLMAVTVMPPNAMAEARATRAATATEAADAVEVLDDRRAVVRGAPRRRMLFGAAVEPKARIARRDERGDGDPEEADARPGRRPVTGPAATAWTGAGGEE